MDMKYTGFAIVLLKDDIFNCTKNQVAIVFFGLGNLKGGGSCNLIINHLNFEIRVAHS